MKTDTQQNWNEYFNNKRKRNFNPLLLIVLLLLVGAVGFTYYNPLKINGVGTVRSMIGEMIHSYDSSYNGVVMVAMIEDTDKIESKTLDYIDQLQSYNAEEIDPEFMKEWGNFISESKKQLYGMKYHPSYSDYIAECNHMLDETEKLYDLISSKKQINIIGNEEVLTAIDNIYNSSDVIDDELMKAFDKNGIDYYEDDDYIHYYYNTR